MKIAVATDGDAVSLHFGRCEGYNFFEIEDGKVISKTYEKNPGHQPGLIPKWLKERDVNCIIAGGAGPKAQEFFKNLGIDFILGVQGKVEEVVEEYLKGELKSGESTCEH